MKLIDFSNTEALLIQKVPTQPCALLTKNKIESGSCLKTSSNQMTDMLHLIRGSVDSISDHERVNQLRHEIGADTYAIDIEALADNIARDLFTK